MKLKKSRKNSLIYHHKKQFYVIYVSKIANNYYDYPFILNKTILSRQEILHRCKSNK